MAFDDPAAPHPVTLGLIVPLAGKVQFRAELIGALNGDMVAEVKRILAGDDALLARLTDAVGLAVVANGLNVHLTAEEWDFLKTANQLLTPATRALVEFSQLRSSSRPNDPIFWEWAEGLGFFHFDE
jgi:hypothetical protein